MVTAKQVATVIEWVPPANLKPHLKNSEVYGDAADPDLIDSIQRLGVEQALYVKRDGTIISGHRRWKAALQAGIKDVPVVRVVYPNEMDEWEAIVEHNRYRKKNGEQQFNEGTLLENVQSVRNEQLRRAKISASRSGETVQNLASSETTREHVANTIGLGSGEQWRKLKEIGQRANKGNEAAKAVLPKIGNSLSLHGAYKQVVEAERRSDERERIKALEPARGTYSVIVIDPPWAYESRASDITHRAHNPYESMTVDQLKDFHIPADNDAILWLWTTNAFLESAFQLVRAWGFTYKTMLTWAKPRIGLGDWLRGQTEHCLMAVRGSYRVEPGGTSTLLHGDLVKHSDKPDEFYALVERLCHGNKIDIFAREQREGWEVWGAQAD